MLTFQVEDVGPAPVAQRHQGLVAGIEKEAIATQTAQVRQGHGSGTIGFLMALGGVVGAPPPRALGFFKAPGQAVEKALDAPLDGAGMAFLGSLRRPLEIPFDLLQHPCLLYTSDAADEN